MYRGEGLVTWKEIARGIWAIDEGAGAAYTFLAKGSEKCAVVDTGFGFCDLPAVIRQIIGDMPLIVINTHFHSDHVSGNSMFEEAYI